MTIEKDVLPHYIGKKELTKIIPYDEKIEAAKRWLGDRYLLAQPISQPKPKTNNWRIENAEA